MPGSDTPAPTPPPTLATLVIQSPQGTTITDFDFGPGDTSLAGAPLSFSILNTGSTTVNLGSVGALQITGNKDDFKVMTPPAKTTLAAGESTTFAMAFCPTATGLRTATATVVPASGGKEASFTVKGTGASYSLVVTETLGGETVSNHGFGAVTVGAQSPAVSFTVTNQSTTSVTIDAITVSGTNALDFVAGALSPGATIAACASATFPVMFAPGSYGARTGHVLVHTPVAQCSFDVSGTGTSGVFSITDDSGSPIFGHYGPYYASETPVIFTISNTASTPLTIAGISLTGDTDAIRLPSSLPSSVPGSSTRTFTMTMGHSGLPRGSYHATLTIQTSDASHCTFVLNITLNFQGI